MPSLSRDINILSRCSNMFRAAHTESEELKPCLQSYILTLCRFPGISQEQIARYTYVDKSSVTRHLAYLEKNGYVERKQSETDKRVTLVYPTQKAIDSRDGIHATIKEWNSYINGAFTEGEAEQFMLLLDKAAARAAEYAEQKIDVGDVNANGNEKGDCEK